MVLLIDNFDSFVYNLARYVVELGFAMDVVRNDALSVDAIREKRPQAIILSPGPCDPSKAGVCVPLIRALGADIPILGVCLGHQAIGAAYGGTIDRAPPVHGRADTIFHDGAGVFEDLPSPFLAARYHSLIVAAADLPEELEVTARLENGTIMGVRHRQFPVVGIQFHPESVLTEHGHTLLANFLRSPLADTPSSSAPLGGGTLS